MRASPRWVEYLLNDLVPVLGGFPTFCEDPDGLLDLPEAREALRTAGMTIGDWDGLPTSLVPYKCLRDDEMPLLVVEPGAPKHVVEVCLHHHRWTEVSIGEMFPKFAHEVVKEVSPTCWDRLFSLHDEVRSPRSTQQTALLIARAVYGTDPEYLKHSDGWLRTLIRLALGDDPLPRSVARAIAESVPVPPVFDADPLEEALTATTTARSLLTRALQRHPSLREQVPLSDQALLLQIDQAVPAPRPAEDTPDLLPLWEEAQSSPQAVLAFGLRYAGALAGEKVSGDTRQELDARFADWLTTHYGVILSSANPALLRLPTLVRTLDEESEGRKLLLVVVDALGLEAWHAVQNRWEADRIIAAAETRVALAVLPTVTSLSRRAIFEGKPPAQFGPEKHSQRLERKLWAARFGPNSGCFTVDEEIGFHDALAKGLSRICVLDVTWDKRGHSIDPRTDSIADAARVWAGKTPLRPLVASALAAGYRVIITADHGQVACIGRERLQVGVLAEERSKRVLLFNDKTVAQHYEKPWACFYKPAGTAADCFPLFARGFGSFDGPGVPSVSHGGMSMEETLVPVAEVRA